MADPAIEQKPTKRKPPARQRTGQFVACDVCNEQHYRKKYSLEKTPKGARLYCSRACRFAESARIDLTCATCGETYNRFQSQGGRGKRSFCSRKCQSSFGLSSVNCCWPGCTHMIPCRLTRGTSRNGDDEYKVDLVKKGQYTRFAFCQDHATTIQKYLGKKSRFTGGRSEALSDPEREYSGRSLSSRFMRMLVFERGGCRCQLCSSQLNWNADPKVWQIDHIVPMYKGGKTKLTNLQVLCEACHNLKSAPEKSDASRERHALTKVNRWLTHHQKDLLIERLRGRLIALGAPVD